MESQTTSTCNLLFLSNGSLAYIACFSVCGCSHGRLRFKMLNRAQWDRCHESIIHDGYDIRLTDEPGGRNLSYRGMRCPPLSMGSSQVPVESGFRMPSKRCFEARRPTMSKIRGATGMESNEKLKLLALHIRRRLRKTMPSSYPRFHVVCPNLPIRCPHRILRGPGILSFLWSKFLEHMANCADALICGTDYDAIFIATNDEQQVDAMLEARNGR